jgi:high-affinity iron transporter
MTDAVIAYQGYVNSTLAALESEVLTLKASVGNNDLDAGRRLWLSAQLLWQQVGAAYGSFGDLGGSINGLPAGLPQGPADPGFTGLHRVEYGLFHGQSPAELIPAVQGLYSDIGTLRSTLQTVTVDPADMPLRCHEILEDSLRDNLTGNNDQGSGMALALTAADVVATRVVLTLLSSLIDQFKAGYSGSIAAELDVVDAALTATKHNGQWPNYGDVTLAQRQPVNGALGRALESLSLIPPIFSTDD